MHLLYVPHVLNRKDTQLSFLERVLEGNSLSSCRLVGSGQSLFSPVEITCQTVSIQLNETSTANLRLRQCVHFKNHIQMEYSN